MKSLHVAALDFSGPDGITSSAIALGDSLVRYGYQTAVLSAIPLTGKVKTLMKVLPCPKSRHFNPWNVDAEWISVIEQRFGIPDWLDFHSMYIPFETSLARLIGDRKKWPYIVTPHGTLQPMAQSLKRVKKIVGNILFNNHYIQKAAAIHALTQEEANGITSLFPALKVIISPNGISPELLTVRERFTPAMIDRDSNTLVLVFVGRIAVYHKGIDLLLKALHTIQTNHKEIDIQLLMIGNFFEVNDKKFVGSLVKSLSLPDAVKFHGPLMGDEKWPYLLAGDIFVHTSRFEGMPMAVLEAMALSKPCLVTPGTNMQSFIRAGSAGWTADGTIESIAKTLIEIFHNKKEIAPRGENARNFVMKHFMWDHIAANYAQQVEKIL